MPDTLRYRRWSTQESLGGKGPSPTPGPAIPPALHLNKMLGTVPDAVAMFAPFVHSYDAVYHAHCRAITLFVDVATPVPREYVLDLGTGSAWVLLEARWRVGSGVINERGEGVGW